MVGSPEAFETSSFEPMTISRLGTILCYGQTGAGKTHTMTGFAESYQNRGVIPRTLQHLYQEINARQEFSFAIR